MLHREPIKSQRPGNPPGKSRLVSLITGSLILLLAAAWISLLLGRYPASARDILAVLAGGQVTDPLLSDIVKIRLTRMALAGMVGATLALTGAVFQALLRNPLAEPFTLGVSTGAAFGATVSLYLGLSATTIYGLTLVPLSAMAGAGLSLALVLALSRGESGFLRPATLILAGMVVSSFLSALISLIKSLADETLSSIVFWLLGSFSNRGEGHLIFLLPYLLPALALALFWYRELDILALGDLEAQHLGVHVARVRFWLLISSCLAAAATVAISGVIGFVGLVIPHLIRLISGPGHRSLLPLSLLLGAGLMILADVLARIILPTGEELPVGVITSLLGGPFFAWLLYRRRREIEGW
ncbi:iron ABC transporter permease [Thermosulfuriphilus ammonigenes]|uniref:Iron ABC transporter permease n=1 Tax=Thermosulfuriphilus ammonigenes TaxID=1936021 RepID=A0A6G7PU45_9BACT|nr:iron ABC transporter permease [Thermosulfuriphilus ammonigenes]MBA2848727.1 iron complex transport system permease protein [Thermosulfuriphilus ammonigenes]QIJ71140.1 iron ABC transporter permease [Thermosulfuriphilus ammonigenes]